MKRIQFKLLLCLGLTVLAGHMNCQAAQAAVKSASDEQSVELGNVDMPDDSEGAGVVADTASQQAAGASMDDSDSVTSTDTKPKPSAETATAPAKAPAATPMEKYRDAKLLQATTPNAGNPASARRYLKVDRATYQESIGGVQ